MPSQRRGAAGTPAAVEALFNNPLMPSTLVQKLKKNPVALRLNAAVKAAIQERRAARTLAFYRAQAEKNRIVEPKEPELIKLLRARLADRPHPIWPKPKGALHVFMRGHHQLCPGLQQDVAIGGDHQRGRIRHGQNQRARFRASHLSEASDQAVAVPWRWVNELSCARA